MALTYILPVSDSAGCPQPCLVQYLVTLGKQAVPAKCIIALLACYTNIQLMVQVCSQAHQDDPFPAAEDGADVAIMLVWLLSQQKPKSFNPRQG